MAAEIKADFGSGRVNAKPVVRNSANTGWQECEKYVRNDANTAWIKVWPLYVAPAVSMPDVSDYAEAQGAQAIAGITLSSNGTFSTAGGFGAGPNSGTWLTAGSAADVEVYATYSGGTGGSWSSTAWSTWVAGGNFYAQLSKSVDGTAVGTINLTFRNKNTLAQLDTATISVEAYRGAPV